ncbi:Ubiquitin-like-specific protease 1 [Mizuhopecten yessoensis]|uniref:Ubiquitin-like-specific protease 1 n=1 Tax=Mizuhopecten yessoensis TaxID=6573 RepID=A0A210PJ97_MIZYE|nr:Ubiquitin-like-specific protease 1 [Mizuhopecten yessoensis]
MVLESGQSPTLSLYLKHQQQSSEDLGRCVQFLSRLSPQPSAFATISPYDVVPGLMVASSVVLKCLNQKTDPDSVIDTLKTLPLTTPKLKRKMPLLSRSTRGRLGIGTTQLTKEDFKTLAPREWVNGQVIHSFLAVLSWEQKQENNHESLILPCLLATKCSHNDYQTWTFHKVPFHIYETVLLPVCHKDHWFLMVAKPKQQELYNYDSLHSIERSNMFAKHWRQFLIARGQAYGMAPQECTWMESPCSRKDDGHSCGVFVMMNAAAVLARRNPLVMMQCHVNNYRVFVRERLILGEL